MRQSSQESQSMAEDYYTSSSASHSPPRFESSEPAIVEQPNGATRVQNAKKQPPAKASSSAAAASGNHIGKWKFRKIINHRWSGNDIELQIHWDDPDETTWEPEKAIHRDAKSTLVSYWSRQPGGRPLNPHDPESFTIFAFKGVRGGPKKQRQILVEWVGWAKPTWEPEAVIKQTAPKLLKEYLQKRSGKQ
ncbi:unnamed protein product [Clonostachys rhizophaga]|uniref:Chromo domain-containing protein n=1 Tax=Clonostachys rhizophaga TaxID=160324 RepID=A0A9N9YFF9_9HYPO|nr:unnamed protein product [Clonostachys rhizophaga]